MLFAPDQLYPDSSSFDAKNSQLFSWRSNGDPQTHYRLKIYNNDTNVLVYDSNVTASGLPQHFLPPSTLSNGGNFKYQLEVFNYSVSVLSDYVFFKTNDTPILTLTVPNTIDTRSYKFTGSYRQSQNIPFNRYKFILYNSQQSPLIDSDWIYGYNIEFNQDGFESGEQYYIELITESQYSIVATTGRVPFTVLYLKPDSESFTLTSVADDQNGGITLNWTPLIQITGSYVGNIEYTTGKFGLGVHLNPSSQVIFNNIIPSSSSILFWVQLQSDFIGDIITIGNDEVKLGYNGSSFYLTADGKTVLGRFTSVPADFFKILLKSDKVIIETSSYTEYL